MQVRTHELRDLRVASAVLLGIAAIRPLAPHVIGLPCPLRSTTGVPCPFCGMTRSVTAAVHGDLARAAWFNPGGIVVVAIAIALLFARPLRHTDGPAVPAWVVPAVLALMWAYQLFKYSTGRPL